MSTEGPLVAFVGLPNTGKTTYLIALWNALQAPSDERSMSLESYPAAAVYLNEKHERWLRGEPVGHTPRDGSELVSLAVLIDDRPVALEIPDLSGETFERLVVERQIERTITPLLLHATGVIVFIHPDHLRPRVTIAQARGLGASSAQPASTGGEGLKEKRTVKPMDRRKLPAELHAVDMLQALRNKRRGAAGDNGVRNAVVVSAWDMVADEDMPPARWLERRMPMLHAFLTSGEADEHRVFGVSAQGDVAGPAVAENDPSTRAWVVEADGRRHHDIAAPVVWAARLD